MLLKKVVVAEDDNAIAHMVTMALGDAGYLCIRARDGEEALHAAKMHQPDVLVLDVMMPKMDGREVAKKLKADVFLSKIPILMLTALSDVDSKVAGLDAGGDDYMVKPFDLRELEARIRALIRSNVRERDRNAITDLPGSASFDLHIEKVLGDASDVVVLQFAVDGFSEFIAEKGILSELPFVKSFSNLLVAEIRSSNGFLAHLGGTDFVATCHSQTSQALTDAAIAGFDSHYSSWTEGPVPPMRLVIGAVAHHGPAAEGQSPEDVFSKNLSIAMREALSKPGSNCAFATPKS